VSLDGHFLLLDFGRTEVEIPRDLDTGEIVEQSKGKNELFFFKQEDRKAGDKREPVRLQRNACLYDPPPHATFLEMLLN
jgi:hypothetical protein